MLSKAHCFSLRQRPLIYLWWREAEEGLGKKYVPGKRVGLRFLYWQVSCTHPERLKTSIKDPMSARCETAFSVFLCVCVSVYLPFNECVSDWDLLGVGSSQAAGTRTRSSPAPWLQGFVPLHLTDGCSSAEKQILLQPLSLTLSELLVLYSSHCSSTLAKALPRKGSKDQLTLGYSTMSKYNKSKALSWSSIKKIQLF